MTDDNQPADSTEAAKRMFTGDARDFWNRHLAEIAKNNPVYFKSLYIGDKSGFEYLEALDDPSGTDEATEIDEATAAKIEADFAAWRRRAIATGLIEPNTGSEVEHPKPE